MARTKQTDRRYMGKQPRQLLPTRATRVLLEARARMTQKKWQALAARMVGAREHGAIRIQALVRGALTRNAEQTRKRRRTA